MANAGPNTNGSQFFVCTAPTDWLNGKHVVFGKLIEEPVGVAALKAIEAQGSQSGKPKTTVTIVDCGQL